MGQLIAECVGDCIILGQFHDLTRAALKGESLVDTEQLENLMGIVRPGCLYWARFGGVHEGDEWLAFRRVIGENGTRDTTRF
tara:strand:- start:66 stop:311 length:246 start_codon:yes stop_codon:yes gene_type:complete